MTDEKEEEEIKAVTVRVNGEESLEVERETVERVWGDGEKNDSVNESRGAT